MSLWVGSTVHPVGSDAYHRIYVKKEVVADSQYPFDTGDNVVVGVIPGVPALIVREHGVSEEDILKALTRRVRGREADPRVIAHE